MRPARIIATADDFLAELELAPLRERARAAGYAEEEVSAADPEALAGALETPPLLDAGRLVLVRDADAATDAAVEVMARWAADPSPGTRLVLLARSPAAARRLAAALGDRVEVRAPEDVPPWEAPAWVVKRARALGRRITPEAARALVEAVGTDLRDLAGALDRLLAGGEGTVDVAAVAAHFRGLESKVHEFVDALFDRDRAQALRRLRSLLAHGENPIGIVAQLASQLRILAMLVGERRPAAAVARELGIKEGPVKRAMRRARNFTPEEIRRAYRLLADADLALKTEEGDPVVLELLVDEIAGPARASRREPPTGPPRGRRPAGARRPG
jgi:DNA polymerase-3 subunit delta